MALTLSLGCGKATEAEADGAPAPPRKSDVTTPKAPPVIARSDVPRGTTPAKPSPDATPTKGGKAATAADAAATTDTVQTADASDAKGPTATVTTLVQPAPAPLASFPMPVEVALPTPTAIATNQEDDNLRVDLRGIKATLDWRESLADLGTTSPASLVAVGSRLVVAGEKAVYALKRSSGEEAWGDSKGSPTVHVRKDKVVLTKPLRVLSLTSGEAVWAAKSDETGDCGPIIGNDHVAFYDIEGDEEDERQPGWKNGESRDEVAIYRLSDFKLAREHDAIVGRISCPVGGDLGFYAGRNFLRGKANRFTWNKAWSGAQRDHTKFPRDAELGRDLVTVRGDKPATVSAHHVNDSELHWRRVLPADVTISDPPLLADDRVILVGYSGEDEAQRTEVLAIDASTGHPLWRSHVSATEDWTVTASADGVWLTAGETVHLLSARTGLRRWSARFDGPVAAPEVYKGRVYLAVAGPLSQVMRLKLRLGPDSGAAPEPPPLAFTPLPTVTTRPKSSASTCGDWKSTAVMEPAGLTLLSGGDVMAAGGAVGRRDAVAVRLGVGQDAPRWAGELRGDGSETLVAAFPKSGGGAVLVGTTRSRGMGDEQVLLVGLRPDMSVAWERLSHGGIGRRTVVASGISTDGEVVLGIQTGGKSLVARYKADGTLRWKKRLPSRRDKILAVRGLDDGRAEVLLSARVRKKGRRGRRYVIGNKKRRETTRYDQAPEPVAAAFGDGGTVWFVSKEKAGKGWRVVNVGAGDGEEALKANQVLTGASGSIAGIHVQPGFLHLLERKKDPPGMFWTVPREGAPKKVALPSTAIPRAWVPNTKAGSYVVLASESDSRLSLLMLDANGALFCPDK